MRRWDYETYIASMDWVNRCRRFFGDRPMCAVRDCRKRWRDGVGIHHITYDRLGNERKEDLVPLCHGCHKVVHNRADSLAVFHLPGDGSMCPGGPRCPCGRGFDPATALRMATDQVVSAEDREDADWRRQQSETPTLADLR